MQAQEVQQLIASQLENCDIRVEGEGANFQVVAIGEVFEGLSPVKKQQLVYGCLSSQIADGTIHAVTMKTYTPQQWAALSGN